MPVSSTIKRKISMIPLTGSSIQTPVPTPSFLLCIWHRDMRICYTLPHFRAESCQRRSDLVIVHILCQIRSITLIFLCRDISPVTVAPAHSTRTDGNTEIRDPPPQHYKFQFNPCLHWALWWMWHFHPWIIFFTANCVWCALCMLHTVYRT